jgi:hypothetical protein
MAYYYYAGDVHSILSDWILLVAWRSDEERHQPLLQRKGKTGFPFSSVISRTSDGNYYYEIGVV